MSPVERNAPCPCGSGKKHKNCCLRIETAKRSRLHMTRGAAPRAVNWLTARHGEAVRSAIDERYCEVLDEDAMARLAGCGPQMFEMFQINAMEWLLAEGELEVEGRRLRASDLLLGPGGPLFTVEQRTFLEQLAERPLRPYEVLESRPGEGLLLRDLLRPEEPSIRVNERLGSRSLVQWDVIGARILTVGSERVLSGAIYAFMGENALEVREALEEALGGRAGRGLEARIRRTFSEDMIVSITLIDHWLTKLSAPPPEIVLRDASTQEPLMLVTDHYEVLGWDALARALKAQPDVDGNRKQGWTRFQPLEGDRRRSLLAINIGSKPDRIEPFARTLRLADEGRAWLERVAGPAIRHLTRDLVDPRTVMKEGSPRAGAERREPMADLSPAQRLAAVQQFYEQTYRDWTDKPIPALDDQTPRAAMASAGGRARVVALLKLYESSEQRKARKEGREPADLGFLWQRVGLDRSAVLDEVPAR